MQNRQKIIFVVNNASFLLSHRQPIISAVVAKGWKSDVYFGPTDSQTKKKVASLGVRAFEQPLNRQKLNPWTLLRSLVFAGRVAARNPDAIYHLFTILPIILWGIPLRLLGRKTVFSLTGMGSVFTTDSWKYRFLRPIIRWLYRFLFSGKNAQVIVQNRDDCLFLVNIIGINANKIQLIRGSGVDPLNLPFVNENDCISPPAIVLPARLIREKGAWDLAKASEILQKNGFEHQIWFAGERDPGNIHSLSVQEISSIQNVSPRISFLGHIDEMVTVLKQATIVCLPTVYREGVPKALIEAAALGRAIVTYDVPGCRDLVIHEKTGMLCPPKDIDSLAANLERLLKDKAKRQDLCLRANRFFKQEFTTDIVISKTLKVYQLFSQSSHPVTGIPKTL